MAIALLMVRGARALGRVFRPRKPVIDEGRTVVFLRRDTPALWRPLAHFVIAHASDAARCCPKALERAAVCGLGIYPTRKPRVCVCPADGRTPHTALSKTPNRTPPPKTPKNRRRAAAHGQWANHCYCC